MIVSFFPIQIFLFVFSLYCRLDPCQHFDESCIFYPTTSATRTNFKHCMPKRHKLRRLLARKSFMSDVSTQYIRPLFPCSAFRRICRFEMSSFCAPKLPPLDKLFIKSSFWNSLCIPVEPLQPRNKATVPSLNFLNPCLLHMYR
jgi:hypothetical protein